ncbi:MAG: hypothetical protein ACK4F9_07540 [Brevinematia bacterium]
MKPILYGNVFPSLMCSKPSFAIDWGGKTIKNPFIKFNALGIIGDLVFFERLLHNNPYFDCVGILDIANENSFSHFFSELSSGERKRKVDSYIKKLYNISLPSFGDL